MKIGKFKFLNFVAFHYGRAGFTAGIETRRWFAHVGFNPNQFMFALSFWDYGPMFHVQAGPFWFIVMPS